MDVITEEAAQPAREPLTRRLRVRDQIEDLLRKQFPVPEIVRVLRVNAQYVREVRRIMYNNGERLFCGCGERHSHYGDCWWRAKYDPSTLATRASAAQRLAEIEKRVEDDVKAYRRGEMDRAAASRAFVRELNEVPPPPCTDKRVCEHYHRCAAELLACYPFAAYLRDPSVKADGATKLARYGIKIPSRDLYDRLYPRHENQENVEGGGEGGQEEGLQAEGEVTTGAVSGRARV